MEMIICTWEQENRLRPSILCYHHGRLTTIRCRSRRGGQGKREGEMEGGERMEGWEKLEGGEKRIFLRARFETKGRRQGAGGGGLTPPCPPLIRGGSRGGLSLLILAGNHILDEHFVFSFFILFLSHFCSPVLWHPFSFKMGTFRTV